MSFAIQFELDTVEVLEAVSNSELIKVKMLIAESGLNRHNMIITPEAIKKSAFTFIGKPILAKYDALKDDAMGHEKTESPVGVCALTEDDIIVESDERSTKLYSIGYMWKRYCNNITSLFEKDGGRPISMEILVTESEKDEEQRVQINAFCGTGTTVLGLDRNPAIPNAYAEMIAFESMVMDMANVLGFSIPKDDWGTGDKIPLSLSKEEAWDGEWGDVDKTALMNKILKAKNYTTLVNNCYLVKESGWQDAPSQHLKYPICTIKEGKLVYAISGCKSALSFLEKNTGAGYYQSAKSKLKKIYQKLGLDTKNFEIKEKDGEKMFNKTEFAQTFSMMESEFREMLQKALFGIKIEGSEHEEQKYWLYDYDDSNLIARDWQDSKMVAIPYSVAEGECKLDLENIKAAKQKWEIIDSDEEDMMSAFVSKMNACSDAKMAKMSEDFSVEKSAFEAKIAELESVISGFEAQKAELERLTAFETKVKEDEKNAAIEFALNEVSEDLKSEQLDEWRNKVSEFENANEFANALKAFAFECSKGKNRQSAPPRIAIPANKEIDKKNNVWDRLG